MSIYFIHSLTNCLLASPTPGTVPGTWVKDNYHTEVGIGLGESGGAPRNPQEGHLTQPDV